MPGTFGNAGVVGEGGVFFHLVSFPDHCYVERLWCLYDAEARAVDGFCVVWVGHAYRLFQANGGDGRLVDGGEAEGGGDDVFADEGADAVVYGDEAGGVDFFEPTFYGLEAGVATGLKGDGCGEVVFFREGLPGLHVVFGQHENYSDPAGIPYKCIQCVNDDGYSVELKELFGHGAFDPCSLAAGDDDRVLS